MLSIFVPKSCFNSIIAKTMSDRRDFLKTGAVAAASLLAGPTLLNSCSGQKSANRLLLPDDSIESTLIVSFSKNNFYIKNIICNFGCLFNTKNNLTT